MNRARPDQYALLMSSEYRQLVDVARGAYDVAERALMSGAWMPSKPDEHAATLVLGSPAADYRAFGSVPLPGTDLSKEVTPGRIARIADAATRWRSAVRGRSVDKRLAELLTTAAAAFEAVAKTEADQVDPVDLAAAEWLWDRGGQLAAAVATGETGY